MNCDEYIAQFLSADADNQLSAEERHLVEDHLQVCDLCRARLGEELELKASIRGRLGIVKTPADVRLRIQAALGKLSERSQERLGGRSAARMSYRGDLAGQFRPNVRRRAIALGRSNSAAYRAASAHEWLAIQLTRAKYLAPVGFVVVVLAASTLMFRADFRSRSDETSQVDRKSVPVFDFAIDRFNQLSKWFAPNVPAEAFRRDNGAYFAWVQESHPLHHVSDELPDISSSYEKMQMPPEFCDFAEAGYVLVGGRVDSTPDGEPVTYTLYRKQTKSILSISLKQSMSAPEGGYWFETHALYSYRGYTICLTLYPIGHFASIIVARAPMVELLRDVAVSDLVSWDR